MQAQSLHHLLQEEHHFLKDKIDQQIFSNSINIIDKPDLIKGMGSQCFDSEGVKTETLNLVNSGVLKNYLVDTYNGKKLNLKSNGRSGGALIFILKMEK